MADLVSTSFVRVLDLICEGPIKGFVHPNDPTRDIYLNDTPVKGADGKLNFYKTRGERGADYSTIHYDYRLGGKDQTYMLGMPAAESVVDVSAIVRNGSPVTRYFSDANLTTARVMIQFPALFRQNSKGKTEGRSVDLAIWVQNGNLPFTKEIEDRVSGVSTGPYQRSYVVELKGEGPWAIRVERVTENDTDIRNHTDFYWAHYTKVVDSRLRYPYSAIVDLSFDAETFSAIPTRSYDLYLKTVKVPANYNPDTRAYSGAWDGTFKEEWTDNPAWIWYDLVTHKRYGLGDYIDTNLVDKWALYRIAQYCDEMVPDGFGGTEPRFTCNVYLTNREEAFKVINGLASVFRAMVYWDAGTLTLSQDSRVAPEERQLFTNANVVDGAFTYQGTSRSARHTVALVSWNDPSDNYRQKYEYVENADGIARYGVRQIEVSAIGCTSRGQANRVGKWLLYTAEMETETVAFQSGLDGVITYPGKVIRIHDSHRVSERYGGRIKWATTTAITMDAPIELIPGRHYNIEVMLPDMTMASSTLQYNPGIYETVTLQQALPVAPNPESIWILTANDLNPSTWRVISVKEDEDHLYSVLAVAHNESKFAHIEDGAPLQTLPIIRGPEATPAPYNVSISEDSTTDSLGVKLNLYAIWESPVTGLTFKPEWKQGVNGNWEPQPITSIQSSSNLDVLLDIYTFRVTAYDSRGIPSQTVYSSPYAMGGKQEIPRGITNLIATSWLWAIKLNWTYFLDQPDLKEIEIVSSHTNDRSTAVRIALLAYPATTYTDENLGNGEVRYYWIRTKNTSDIWSDYYPSSSISGVRGITLNDAEPILTILSGQIAGTLAGQSLGQRLDKIDYPGTGLIHVYDQVQADSQSLAAEMRSLGARLESDGDIGEAIYRSVAMGSVRSPTPYSYDAPSNPKIGQAWYNAWYGTPNGYPLTREDAFYWVGSAWTQGNNANYSSTPPPNPQIGGLWCDIRTPFRQYKIWNGEYWFTAERATTYHTASPYNLNETYIGDLWAKFSGSIFDGSHELFVYDGSTWTALEDSNISALASQVTNLQTTVGNNTSQIQQQLLSINGIKGLYSIKIQTGQGGNTSIAGFALSNELLNNGTNIRAAVFQTDRFAVTDNVDNPVYPFIIVTAGAGAGVYMKSAMIQDATIGTLKLAGEAVTVPRSASAPGPWVGSSLTGPDFQYIPTVTTPVPGSGVQISSCIVIASATLTLSGYSQNDLSEGGPIPPTLIYLRVASSNGQSAPTQTYRLPAIMTNNISYPLHFLWRDDSPTVGGSYTLQLAARFYKYNPNGMYDRFENATIVALGTKR